MLCRSTSVGKYSLFKLLPMLSLESYKTQPNVTLYGNFPTISCFFFFIIIKPVLQIEGPSLNINPKSIKHNFARANYLSMNTYFNTINWDSLLDDSLKFPAWVTNFYFIISCAINLFTPKFYNHKSSYAPWYNKELKTLI